MYKLIKLKELIGYRFFQNFRWDENNCDLFARYNIIYGWNGTGKTTLCDFFKELETSEISEEETRVSLLFEDTITKNHTTITRNKLNTIPYEFRVYHNRYIQDTISEVDRVKHIFAVGSGQKERIEELKELKSKQKSEEATLKTLNATLVSLETTFEQLKSSKASDIKNAANYSGAYNKNKFFGAFKALKNLEILSDKDYQQALSDIRAEKKADISIPIFDFIRPSVEDVLTAILEETPTNIIIEALKDDIILNEWVEQGLSIHEHKETVTCQFCGSKISEERLETLKSHFNKSYKELSNRIDEAIKLLKIKAQQFEVAAGSVPNSGLFYNELKNKVELLSIDINALANKNIDAISEIIEILIHKKGDMINLSYVSQFKEAVKKLDFDYSVFTQLINVINTHNNKTAEFQKSIETAQQKIEKHMISTFVPEMTNAENAVNEKRKEVKRQEDIITAIKFQVGELDKQVRNSQIPAEAMNKDIAFIMGRDELVFVNKPFGYQITRKGKIAQHLSNGEANAIALIYFFNTLSDVDSDLQNTIVILDDPISSFDSNFYYNAISYIRDKTNDAGQVFVFTHKFSLLKDYSLMYKGETNRYMMQRMNDTPILKNEDNLISQFHDEYAFLFKQVYNLTNSKAPTTAYDYLLYPNIARRLLEGFLTFKIPSDDTLMDKVLKLEAGTNTAAGRAMLRLLNNYSHLRVINDNSIIDDTSTVLILPNTLKYLLEFIKHHDNLHYSMLVQQCRPGESCGEESNVPPPAKRIVKLYDLPASAGTGTFMFDEDASYKEIEVENDDCSFAIKISGDSMEPDIPNDSIVLVKETEEVPHAKVGIFFYNGEAFCKKKIDTPSGTLLVSLNKKYNPIKISEDSTYKTFGTVIEIW